MLWQTHQLAAIPGVRHMLTADQINAIHRLHWAEHWSLRKIAHHLHIGRPTVTKYLQTPAATPQTPAATPKTPAAAPTTATPTAPLPPPLPAEVGGRGH